MLLGMELVFSNIFSNCLESLLDVWLTNVCIIFFFSVPFLFLTASSRRRAAGFPIPMPIKSSVVT